MTYLSVLILDCQVSLSLLFYRFSIIFIISHQLAVTSRHLPMVCCHPFRIYLLPYPCAQRSIFVLLFLFSQ